MQHKHFFNLQNTVVLLYLNNCFAWQNTLMNHTILWQVIRLAIIDHFLTASLNLQAHGSLFEIGMVSMVEYTKHGSTSSLLDVNY